MLSYQNLSEVPKIDETDREDLVQIVQTDQVLIENSDQLHHMFGLITILAFCNMDSN